MNITAVRTAFFSPTGGTKKVLDAIAAATGLPPGVPANLTTPRSLTETIPAFRRDELVVLGAPVYSGRLPRVAAQRIQRLKAPGTPAVLVVVYGNRDYEDALRELRDTAVAAGFTPIAAAAFIGEHSFSNSKTPIAADRPDQADIEAAAGFGRQVQAKLAGLPALEAVPALAVPGNHPYKAFTPAMEEQQAQTTAPVVDAAKCIACGTCVNVCPVGVAAFLGPSAVGRCLRCHTCIRRCPTAARSFPADTPTAAGIAKAAAWLSASFSQRREPVLFL